MPAHIDWKQLPGICVEENLRLLLGSAGSSMIDSWCVCGVRKGWMYARVPSTSADSRNNNIYWINKFWIPWLKKIRQVTGWDVLAPGPWESQKHRYSCHLLEPITCQALCEVLLMQYLTGFSQKSHEEKIITCALCCGYCGLNLCKAAQHIRADPICTSLPVYSLLHRI